MKLRNLFWGVFFILAAVVIILKQSGFLVGVSLINLIITILLIPIMFKSIKHRNFSGILFPIAIIGILYANILGIQNLVPWPILGVALFLSIGLTIMFPPKFHKYRTCCSESYNEDHSAEAFEEVIDSPDGEIVDVYTKFGGSVKYVNSENLKKVNVECSFGGMKVYFDNAKLSNNQAIVNLDVDFSGVEIFVPKDWKVIKNVDCIFGAVEEKHYTFTEKSDNLLKLTGKVSFGGVEIKYI